MPIRVRYKNQENEDCCIRPTPFVAISTNNLKNKEGEFGVTYSITLTGTLLPAHGSPFAINPATNVPYDRYGSGGWQPTVGPEKAFAVGSFSSSITEKPAKQDITGGIGVGNQILPKYASAILSKQRVLRALFARDGQRLEISDVMDNAGATIVCYPRVVSVDFEGDSPYTTKSNYTINLEADFLLRGNFNDEALIVDDAATLANSGIITGDIEQKAFLESLNTHFVEGYSEDWALEVDDALSEDVANPRTYRITHNLQATGKTVYGDSAVTRYDEATDPDPNAPLVNQYKPAWMQARDFVQSRLSSNPSGNYPNIMGQIGSGTVDLVSSYGGYNHVRTEQINVTEGTYSVSENWILASGNSTENYSMTTSTSNSDPFVTVGIEGSIKGLSSIPPSGLGDPDILATSGPYANARNKYNQVTNSGQFGLTSDVFKRANNLVAVQLNSQPVSLSISTNQFTGDVSYSLSFNNRPTNIVSGVIAESIQVNDTYPGDIFATIPVLGRATGPILQYIGGRTEYKRDVSINLTMDYTKIPYGNNRNSLILKKPSIVEPTASQISQLLGELSPAGEPGVRKYFISAPTESWSPKEGTYSFNISWTYEMDR